MLKLRVAGVRIAVHWCCLFLLTSATEVCVGSKAKIWSVVINEEADVKITNHS